MATIASGREQNRCVLSDQPLNSYQPFERLTVVTVDKGEETNEQPHMQTETVRHTENCSGNTTQSLSAVDLLTFDALA